MILKLIRGRVVKGRIWLFLGRNKIVVPKKQSCKIPT